MGVEGLAVALAWRHGVDGEKVLLAALLHDFAKGESLERQKALMAGEREFGASAEDMEHPQMWHGIAAAALARSEFGVSDGEILEAVAYHTTGAEGLGRVGQVIYVADFLEPTRDFPGVEVLRRELLGLPLGEAARRVAGLKVESVRRKGRKVHSRSLRMAGGRAGNGE